MATNVSGFGLKIQMVASVTFPAGINLSQFADDADSLDFPTQEIGDAAMGTNGDLVFWKKAVPNIITLNLIPGSDDDQNMSILAFANKAVRGKLPITDVITMNIMYPDNTFVTLLNGYITSAMPGKSLASTGKLKTRTYTFKFESDIQKLVA